MVYMTIGSNGERYCAPLQHTRSGHIILPMGDWDPASALQDMQGVAAEFFVSDESLLHYLADPYFGDSEQEILSLEDFIRTTEYSHMSFQSSSENLTVSMFRSYKLPILNGKFSCGSPITGIDCRS